MDDVTDFVKGNVVGIPVRDLVYVGDIEYVIDGVTDFVNGNVVGIALDDIL